MTAATKRLGDAPPAELLDPAERMSVDELRTLQLGRLKWTLRHAWDNVPHYRRRFEEHGVHPDDCRELADIAKFPTTTKADLRETYPFGMFAVPRERIARIHASSGTTGRPTVVGYTGSDLDRWAGLVARSIRRGRAPRPPRARRLRVRAVHRRARRALRRGEAGCDRHPGLGRHDPAAGAAHRRLRPEVIMLTPSYMLTLLDEFERQGVDPRTTSLQVGILGAEPWTERMRAEIEERAGIHAVDIYGLSEVMGPGVSQECVETKDGLHIWEDHFLPEVVDPLDGTPLPDGAEGELLFTSLTKEGLPIIRYRTRDLTTLLRAPRGRRCGGWPRSPAGPTT